MNCMGIVKAGQNLADAAAAASLLAAALADQWTAVAAAVVSVGAIVIPRVIDWYKAAREARREQHKLDVETETGLIANEVRRRVEMEEQVDRLRAEIKDLRAKMEGIACPFADADGARCQPGDRPEGNKDLKT